jgi:hypothetical protein
MGDNEIYVCVCRTFLLKFLAFSLKKACQPFSLYSATVTLWLVFLKFLVNILAWQAVVAVVICGFIHFLMMQEKTVL